MALSIDMFGHFIKDSLSSLSKSKSFDDLVIACSQKDNNSGSYNFNALIIEFDLNKNIPLFQR